MPQLPTELLNLPPDHAFEGPIALIVTRWSLRVTESKNIYISFALENGHFASLGRTGVGWIRLRYQLARRYGRMEYFLKAEPEAVCNFLVENLVPIVFMRKTVSSRGQVTWRYDIL